MRLHITLDDGLVAQLDRRVGSRQRSAFISETVRRALEDERRWEDIEAGLGALAGSEHDWDADPGAWVREQRLGDSARVG
jgi:metal-responsive CopG/Arc/MetJ family transcriptional regulator